MRKFKLLRICLSLFDGGGAGDGATAAANGQPGAAAPGGDGSGTQGGSQASPAPTRRGHRSGETQRVLYGKQSEPTPQGHFVAAKGGSGAAVGDQDGAGGDIPPVAGEETKGGEERRPTDSQPDSPASTPEEKRKAYRALVEGEFKDVYTEDTQRIIDRRFRETRSLEEKLGQFQPVIDTLMQRYRIADGDLSKLAQAVENDNAYWSQAAEEAGMSVEQYKQLQKLQRENAALLRAQQQSEARQQADRRLRQWYTEAEQVKGVYPSFDLGAESRNPQFLSMLKAGVPVRHAYEVIHMEEIKAGVAALQAKATEKQVVDGIRAKGARPQEAGTSSQSAFIVKDDVSKLSRKDRAEIARRVARGEHIMF